MKKSIVLLIFAFSLSADTLNVAVYDFPPCVIVEKNKRPTGFDIDVLDSVLNRAGLQSKYIIPTNFPDLMKGIDSGIYDCATSGITITGERECKVDFTHPYLNSGLSILIKKGTVVNPFKTILRYISNIGPMLLLILFFTGLYGILMFFLEKSFARKESQFSPDEPLKGIFNSYYFANVSTTTMGFGDFVPKSVPGKILTIIMAIIGIYFILPYATANMNMALQQEQGIYSISSPEDLPGKIVATEEGTTSETYLNKIGCNVMVVHKIDEAYELLDQEKVNAVVFDMPTIKDFVKHIGKNRFKISGPMFDWQVYGFALKKNSPYRKLINENLADFMRTDDYWNLHKKWFGD